jgi:WD40 repeat protein
MNTINCLAFPKTSENIFLAGSRDGMVKAYDIRSNASDNGPVLSFKAHSKKLNQVCFNSSDSLLLTSGRDSSIRLWDLRFLRTDPSDYPSDLSFLSQYTSHLCVNYSIGASFLPSTSDASFLLTGSEDSLIYVYDVRTSSEPFITYPTGSKTVHLVKGLPGGGLVHAGLEEGSTYSVWQVVNGAQVAEVGPPGEVKTDKDREKEEQRELGRIKRAFHSGMFFGMGPEDIGEDEGEEEDKVVE